MATEVKMPRLSLTMESGVVLQWLKAEGDPITKGEDLAEVETDKVNVVMESPASGYVRTVLVRAGVTVPCDTVLAILTESVDEDLGMGPRPDVLNPAARPAPVTDQSGTPAEPAPAAQLPGGRIHVNASPAAKNLARELGIDLSQLTGSGPGGRIGLQDVQRAADARRQSDGGDGAATVGGRRVPLSKMRAAIAQRMVASVTTIPQFTVRRRVDMSKALELRSATSGAGPARSPGVVDVLHLAVTRALREHPEMNASFVAAETPDTSHILLHDAVHLGVAVALPEGLVVPVIHNADRMGLAELTAARVRLQDETVAGRLAPRSLSGATFTVSNLGTLHVDEFTAIINPPEAAILAVGRLQPEVVVRDGGIYTLPMIALTVTADHRVVDGAQVARFLETMARYIAEPERLT